MGAGLRGQQERVSVKVGVVRAEPAPQAPVPLCLVGLVSEDAPWYAERFPYARVRATRSGWSDAAVEHLRFSGREDVSGLPGLGDAFPSRLRDAVRLAAAGGAVYIDVLIARLRGARPWQLDHPDLAEILTGSFELMQGSILVFPDSAGPPALGPSPVESVTESTHRLRRALPPLAQGLTDRYQIALFDLPGHAEELLRDLPSVDAAICRWQGSPRRLAAHGWRSPATAVGAMLAQPTTLMTQGVSDQRLNLGPGRAVLRDRWEGLRGPVPAPVEEPADALVLDLHLQDEADQAVVRGQSTLRRPLLEWPLPALRTLKVLHMRLVRAADPFVFRPVQPIQAFALTAAIEQVIRPFFQTGLLVGPDGVGPPELSGNVVEDRSAPGLVATISGQIRPWCRQVVLRVGVRAGGSASVDVRA